MIVPGLAFGGSSASVVTSGFLYTVAGSFFSPFLLG
jgi:hypothetical protein